MEPILKRIGDVTIERLSARPETIKNETMNSESDTESSEGPSSDEEHNPDVNIEDFDEEILKKVNPEEEPVTQKRKNEFVSEQENQTKKKKCEIVIKSVEIVTPKREDANKSDIQITSNKDISRTFIANDEEISRTPLNDEEDSEYDSEEESDIDMPIPDLADSKVDQVSVLDEEKTDLIETLADQLGESSSKPPSEKIDTSEYDYDITEKLKEMGKYV